MLYEWDLVKCQYLCTYIRILHLFHHCIYVRSKGRAAAIWYIELYWGTHKHVHEHTRQAQTPATKCATTPHCPDTSAACNELCIALYSTRSSQLPTQLQLQLLGRSSVSEWTRLWPLYIPRRSAERREASLKDTFPPLLCSNSIFLTG